MAAPMPVPMPGSEITMARRVIMPSRKRRVLMLFAAALVGGLVAGHLPDLIRFESGAVVLTCLAAVAGLATLWSP